MSEWMDVKEAAKYLKVKEWTIYEWLRNKKIPASRLVGQWRFNKEVIDNWLSQHSDDHKIGRQISIQPQKTANASNAVTISQEQSQLTPETSQILPPIAPERRFSFMERRQEERILLKKREMFVKIFANFPGNQEIICQIIDMNSSGLAFRLEGEKEGILSGALLRNIVVSNDKYQKTIGSAKVRYCQPVNEDSPNELRVGIEFDVETFEHSVIRRKLLGSYKIRMPRYGGGAFGSLAWQISFAYNRKDITSEKLVNFSKFGIAFAIPKQNSPSLKKGDVLSEFFLSLEDNLVYSGTATVVDLEENLSDLIVRCSLDSSIDLEKIFSIVRSDIEAEDIERLILTIEKLKDAQTDFKAEVADLKLFLEKTKEKLDAEEKGPANKKEAFADRERYDKSIIDKIFEPMFLKLRSHFENIWKLTVNFDEEKYNFHKRYFQEQLKNLFLIAPFITRSVTKPLGYPGDYQMINMVYDNPFEGEGVFAKVQNAYPIREKTSQAVRNRIPYLMEKFDSLLKEKNKQIMKIMSVGSGPAREVQEVIKTRSDRGKFNFTLLDADKEAIAYSQERITYLLKEKESKIEVNFINKDIVQLIKEKDLVDAFGKYDLIYSVGLFDYLTLNVSQRLAKSLYEFLNPGGRLIIGNFNRKTGSNKVYMDFVLEWYLFYRSQDEMLRFTDKLDKSIKTYFETEDTGLTDFLVIERP